MDSTQDERQPHNELQNEDQYQGRSQGQVQHFRQNSSLHLRQIMARLGHTARRRTLLKHGVSLSAIAEARASGYLVRPKRGWYHSPVADSDQRRAVLVGGRIGCVTALRRWGVWGGPTDELHVHVAPTASRLRVIAATDVIGDQRPNPSPKLRIRRITELSESTHFRVSDTGIPVIHWRDECFEARALDWLVSPADALAEAVRCLPLEHAVACVDSALRHRVIDSGEWRDIHSALPERLSMIGTVVDASSDSGLESIARQRLRARGHSVESQHPVPGVGRIDLLIDGLIAFETDGDAFHSSKGQRANDRTRTLLAASLGLPTIRIGSEHLVPTEWPLVLAALDYQLDAVRRLTRSRRVRAGRW
jgi:hypothetical protein